jgi:hypothetical protein
VLVQFSVKPAYLHDMKCIFFYLMRICLHLYFEGVFNFRPGGCIFQYILSGQGLLISLEGTRECLHCTKALEGSREGKGETACTVLYSCIAYITRQQGRVSEVHHQQSLVRRDITLIFSVSMTFKLLNKMCWHLVWCCN